MTEQLSDVAEGYSRLAQSARISVAEVVPTERPNLHGSDGIREPMSGHAQRIAARISHHVPFPSSRPRKTASASMADSLSGTICSPFLVLGMMATRPARSTFSQTKSRYIEERRKPVCRAKSKPGQSLCRQYPHVNISERMLAAMVQLGDRLGLSPASRARIQVPDLGKPTSVVAAQLLGD